MTPAGIGADPPSEEPGLHLAEADAHLKADRFEDALSAAREAVAAWPGHAPAHVMLGDALYRRGDFDEAEQSYRHAVALDADNAAARFGVGRILRTLGRYADAAPEFQAAARLSPATLRYQRVLSNHLERREDVLVVLRHYLGMAKLRPSEEPESMVRNVEAWVALLEQMGTAPLNEWVRREPADLPLSVIRGQVFVEMRVGAIEGQRFVFDTGATGLTVSPRLARRAGLAPIRPFSVAGTGARARETGTLTVLPELALGDGVILKNVPGTIRDPLGREEGLVGPSLLAAYCMTIDLKRGRLRLADARPEPGGAAFERFRNVGGQVVIRARLNGIPLNAMIDTGSTVTIVGSAALSRVPGIRTQPKSADSGATLGIGGALADRRLLTNGTLTVAGLDRPMAGLVSGNLTGFSRSLESEIYVILGVPILKERPFTIDYRDMTVGFQTSSR